MVKSNSEYRSIRKKLMAAIAMVLVASIMMVSASYAWFTLSTAPEVTGITTSVGSNGNLEMALRTSLSLDEIGTSTGATFPNANNYWGNLVDLSDESYHLDEVELRPARLNVKEDMNAKTVQATTDGVQVWTKDGKYYACSDAAKMAELGYTKVQDEVDDPDSEEENKTIMVDRKKDAVPLWKVTTGEGDSATTNEFAADLDLMTELGLTNSNKVLEKAYKLDDSTGFLKTPEYGADGRISLLDANTINGLYDPEDEAFKEDDSHYGIRAVGVASEMSPAALKLRNAKQAVNAAISNTKTSAQISLRDDSVKLADIIVGYTLSGDSVRYGKTETDNIQTAIDNLSSIKSELEAALIEAVVAVGVYKDMDFSAKNVTYDETTGEVTIKDDEGQPITMTWTAEAVLGEDNAPVVDAAGQPVMYEDLTDEYTDLKNAFKKLGTLSEELETAQTALTPLKGRNDITYTEIAAPLESLMKVNDFTIIDSSSGKSYSVSEFKTLADTNTLAAVRIILGTPTISIKSGAYYTVAEFSGNYSATTSMTVTGSYGGQSLDNETITVVMATAANEAALTNGFHLPYITNWISSLAISGGTTDTLMTDVYGYIVDLAFRTNAANSSLLLQTEAANRVSDSTATQGGGSYMEFKSGHQDFTLQQVAGLMQSIRVVFTDAEGSALYGIGMLDVDVVPVYDGNPISAAEYEALKVSNDDAEKATVKDYVRLDDGTYQKRKVTTADALFKKVETIVDDTNTEITTYYEMRLVGGEVTQNNAAIKAPIVLANFTVDGNGVITVNDAKANAALMELPVNTPVALSALVYLDGDTVENADVAISGTSMTGTMNLQFASDANLVPMDYSYDQMTTPTSVAVDADDKKLTIPVTTFGTGTNAANATSYDIYVDGVKRDNVLAWTTTDEGTGNVSYTATEYDLSVLKLEAGEYDIQVVAKAFNYADSDKSAVVTYTVAAASGDEGTQG